MPERRPEEEHAIPAEIVEDDATGEVVDANLIEVPPPEPAPVSVSQYVPQRNADGLAGLRIGLFFSGLALVLVFSILFRVELTDAYERAAERLFGIPRRASRSVRIEVGDTTSDANATKPVAPTRPATAKTTNDADEDIIVPAFPERKLPKATGDTVVVVPHTPKVPGFGYSPVDRKDLSADGVARCEFRVVVPENYKEDDYRRVSADIVRLERKVRKVHAARLLFFPDTDRLEPEHTLAVVIWAPGGDFKKAVDAIAAGVDKNKFSIRVLK